MAAQQNQEHKKRKKEIKNSKIQEYMPILFKNM